MISKYDISKLQDLNIEEVANSLNITVSRHKAVCPFHDDTRPSLTFNIRKNRYRCYVCDSKGGVIDLVMHTQGWNFYESCKWLASQFGIILSDEKDIQFKPIKKQEKKFSNSQILDEQKPDIPYLERLMAQPIINERAANFLFNERKISREVVRKIGLSSIAYNCPMSSSPKPTYFDGPALLIPYRDIDGNLMSVQSRYLGDSRRDAGDTENILQSSATQREIPRFRFPKGSHCTIFNLPVLKDCNPHEPVFITEGVTDCLAMLSAGFKSIAIPSATLLSEQDKQQLLSLSSSLSLVFHIYPDQDEPGERLFLDLKAICPNIVRHQLPVGFKDVGQYYSFIHKDDKIL